MRQPTPLISDAEYDLSQLNSGKQLDVVLTAFIIVLACELFPQNFLFGRQVGKFRPILAKVQYQ